jgi:flagellar biosynthesis/type III secretory pathway protein FliH
MAASSNSTGRVLRGIEVRDVLSLHERGRSAYTDEDLDDAYRRGAIDARLRMTEEREDAVRTIAAAMQDSSTALRGALDEFRSHYQGRVIDDAFAYASWLLCREITADPNLMRARVEEALAGVEDQTPMITVAPEMTDLVGTWLPSATVRPDASLRPGEVRMLSASTTIDGTFADAQRRLHAAFDSDPAFDADAMRGAGR